MNTKVITTFVPGALFGLTLVFFLNYILPSTTPYWAKILWAPVFVIGLGVLQSLLKKYFAK